MYRKTFLFFKRFYVFFRPGSIRSFVSLSCVLVWYRSLSSESDSGFSVAILRARIKERYIYTYCQPRWLNV